MKWGVTADLQFDLYPSLSTLKPDGTTSRLQDMLNCWRWIVDECAKRHCKGLLVIGDIFNSRTEVDISVLDQVCRAFHEASKRIPLTILVGNHDSYLKNPNLNSAQVFKGMATIIDTPTVDGKFAFVPWMDDLEAFEAAVAEVSTKKAKFLFSHVLVEGAVPKGKGLPLDALKPKRFKQVFLGDVHEPMSLRSNVQYVGSPMQIDYRDAGKDRWFIIFDDDTGHVEFHPNKTSPRFHIIEDANTKGIRQKDFTRVKSDDPEIAQEAATAAREKCGWVESFVVPDEEIQPRLNVRTQDAQEDVLRKFIRYQGVEASEDELIALGLELLGEANG